MRPVRTDAGSAIARLLGGADDGTVAISLPDHGTVEIRRIRKRMQPWGGPLPAGFGLVPNKIAVDVDGVCAYPELAVVAGFRAHGWDARWRKNFGGSGWWLAIGDDEAMPRPANSDVTRITDRARGIAAARGRTFRCGGIWDVLAWRDRKFLFVEVKGKEPFNKNQLIWLEAALDLQVPVEAFAVVRYAVDGGPG